MATRMPGPKPGPAAATKGGPKQGARLGLLSRRARGTSGRRSGTGTAAPAAAKQGRVAQIRAAYTMTRRADPRVGLVLAAWFVGVLVVFLLVGLLVSHPIYLGILGVMAGFLAATIVFGKRAERAAYSQLDGQPGAAAASLQMLRRGWTVTPGVAVNRNQDLVHRAVGRPGVVLVGEGAPSRVGHLLTQEKKRLARIVPDVPVYDFQAGDGDGQVPLAKLQREVMRLPRNLRPAQVAEVEKRLKAVGAVNLPIPKGPLPKNARMPRGGGPRPR